MDETQLDRFEKKFDRFVEYVQGECNAVRAEMAGEFNAVRAEMAGGLSGVRAEMAGGLSGVRAEMAEGLTAVRAEVASLRSEMRAQFETVTDRLKRLEHSYTSLNFEVIRLGKEITAARSEIDELRGLILRLETQTLESHVRVSQFRDDMQQRFRVVNDRLAAMEKLLAA